MPEPDPPEPSGGTRPLSHRTSKFLVIVMVLFAVAAALGASYFLISTARNTEHQAPPPDSVQAEHPSPRK